MGEKLPVYLSSGIKSKQLTSQPERASEDKKTSTKFCPVEHKNVLLSKTIPMLSDNVQLRRQILPVPIATHPTQHCQCLIADRHLPETLKCWLGNMEHLEDE